MGLLTIIRKSRRKEKEMRILFLGLDNAGKTTILKKISGEDISSISPTLGFNIKTFVHRSYTLNIWDVGGQRTLRPYWRNYFEQTDAIVWVVDSSDRVRIQDCKEELHNLLQEDRLTGASLLLLGLSGIKSHHWKISPCSAVTGYNLIAGLDWVVEDVARRLYYSSVVPDGGENSLDTVSPPPPQTVV
ncbi:GTP-binding protein [Pisolithus orientalis]|uniref:GTP-binding protein n=1 Tax=Pisolithus orientalis TaxID=936130 RepID=UPI002224AED3|nr:GTP-binding protein [Pisolithus orientalis]KAI6035637.1 GTP-binding protein [Pisolithus orientalis]